MGPSQYADDCGLLVSVLEDCCASPDMELHRLEIEKILPLFGTIRSSKDIIKDIDSLPNREL